MPILTPEPPSFPTGERSDRLAIKSGRRPTLHLVTKTDDEQVDPDVTQPTKSAWSRPGARR